MASGIQRRGERIPRSGACPVCGQNSLRHYYYLDYEDPREIRGVRYRGKGSVWEWCASCGTYSHAQAYVPEAWSGPMLDLDHSRLTPVPDTLDDFIAKRAAAQWYKAIVWKPEEGLPGERTTVLAHCLEDARDQLVEQFGEGSVISLYNEDDADSAR